MSLVGLGLLLVAFSIVVWTAGLGIHDHRGAPVYEIAFSMSREAGNPETGAIDVSEAIYGARSDGRELRRLTPSKRGSFAWDPVWSPNGRFIAFTKTVSKHGAEVFVMGADGSGMRQLTRLSRSNEVEAWSPDGKSLLVHNGGYPPRCEIEACAYPSREFLVPVAGGKPLRLPRNGGFAWYIGTDPHSDFLLAFSNKGSRASTINAVSSDGSVRRLTSRSFVFNESSISRDGRRFTLINDPRGTWVVSGRGKILRWLSRKDAYLSPDGRFVGWEWYCGGVCVAQVDNPNARRLVNIPSSKVDQWSWSPDSRSLLVSIEPTDGAPVEMKVVAVGGRSSREISSTKGLISAYGGALEQEWSPDSRFVAFAATSREIPPSTLFVARADGSGAPVSLATATTGSINGLAWRPVPSNN